MASPIRFVKEIGLHALSRGESTCRWKTDWCRVHCYNRKFYRVNPKLPEVDESDNTFWMETPAADIAGMIRLLDVERFRFAVRGEIWICERDVDKVRRILNALPETLFWIPTRAWQVVGMEHAIEERILPLKNARVMASIDPHVSECTERALKQLGWSTVFTGDNEDPRQLLLSVNGVREKRTRMHVKCVKTWSSAHGHCAECTTGCFSKERVDVHLKQHR